MKNLKFATMVISLLLFFNLTYAQSVKADLVKDWKRAKDYTKEYLDAMPATKYSFKPTPEMRSFAEQMLHLANGNYSFSSAAVSEKNPYEGKNLEKTIDKSKDSVVKIVLASYDFVIEKLEHMSENQLNEKVTLFDKFEMRREVAFNKAFEHQTHHRGQTVVYLRLAGITPPGEKLF